MEKQEELVRKRIADLPDDKARLRFLQEETYSVDPFTHEGRQYLRWCNRIALEIIGEDWKEIEENRLRA